MVRRCVPVATQPRARELAMIGKKMHRVKSDMDDDYRDPHKFARD